MKLHFINILILTTTVSLFYFSCAKKSETESVQSNNSYQVKGKTVQVYTTADSTDLKISPTDTLSFSDLKQPLETQTCIFVNPDKQFQTFMGIGGAITDASAEVFAKLSPEKQTEFLNAYFDEKSGNAYKIIRTNMNSCDFSSASYTYIQEGDKDLQTFDIAPDKKFKIPMIKRAMEKAVNANFYISPWSPPAFMKDNKDMLHGGKLLPEFYQSWADYYVKFIQSYEKEGVPVWGLTIQNEPMAKQIWESCIYTAEEERDFLKNFLGPTLAKAQMQDKKITVWDHNRDLMSQRADIILNDPDAAKYVWGVGFHWYEDWSGGKPMFQNVGIVNKNHPEVNLMFTEGCVESFDASKYQLWKNGAEYGVSMINDFNNGTVAWTDWNILLDQNGGPNHVKNFCFAPIHADLTTGDLIYTPSYYIMGHFSRFIKPGAKRISSVASRSSLLSTSFLNPDGKVVTIVMNIGNEKTNYFLSIGTNATELTILPNAIQTLIY
jgi:glucosylceramidase